MESSNDHEFRLKLCISKRSACGNKPQTRLRLIVLLVFRNSILSCKTTTRKRACALFVLIESATHAVRAGPTATSFRRARGWFFYCCFTDGLRAIKQSPGDARTRCMSCLNQERISSAIFFRRHDAEASASGCFIAVFHLHIKL